MDPYATNGHRGPRVPGDLRPPRPDWPRGAPYPSGPYSPGPYSSGPGPAGPGPESARQGTPDLTATPPYGRILIFTLLEDRVADFDRLAEQTAEEVRTREPDTLVYVIHLVPDAPMQRIFYEIYRDRAAFDSHENQPYMQRFVADRRACVLATNVIELRLKYAKVAPLPGPPAPSRPAAPPPVQPRGVPRPQTLEPLPPRADERTPPRADERTPPRADERMPPRDGRRMPSAGRRYDGI